MSDLIPPTEVLPTWTKEDKGGIARLGCTGQEGHARCPSTTGALSEYYHSDSGHSITTQYHHSRSLATTTTITILVYTPPRVDVSCRR